MKNRILVIYNTCGLVYEPNEQQWIEEIQLILNQSLPGVHVVHSDCGSSKEKRDVIKEKFGNKISYYHTPESLPVQQTCNHALKNAIKSKGEFQYYCYLGAGIGFHFKHQLALAYKVALQDDTLGKIDFHIVRNPKIEPAEEMHPPFDFYNVLDANRDMLYFPLRPGQRVNNHCAMFSHEYCKSFDYRILPDCFAGNGAEGVYTFLTACINKRHVVLSYHYCPSLFHIPDMDGANQFLVREKKERTYFYDWVFNKSVDLEKLNLTGHSLGFLTDTPDNEHCKFQNPRPEFTEAGIPKTEQQRAALYELISKNIFIDKKFLDYDTIEHEFIP